MACTARPRVPDFAADPPSQIERIPFLGVQLARLTSQELVGLIREAVDQRRCITFSYVHFHTINLLERSPAAVTAFRGIDVVTPDGIAVVLSSRLLGTRLSRRN